MVGTRIRYTFCDDKIPSLSDTMKIGAFADGKRRSAFEPELIIPNVPFSKLFTEKLSPDRHSERSQTSENDAEQQKTKIVEEEKSKTSEERSNEESNGNIQHMSLEARLEDLVLSARDDFIMKTPFASSNEKVELSKFYREWQAAPPLQEFVELPPLEVLDVTKQLETFESDLNEYDSIVQSLCQSPNNN